MGKGSLHVKWLGIILVILFLVYFVMPLVVYLAAFVFIGLILMWFFKAFEYAQKK